MDTKTIKELIEIVEQSAITSFELEEAGYRIRIGKSPAGAFTASQPFTQDAMFPHPPEHPMGQMAPAASGRMQGASPEVHVAEAEISGDNVLSPMLGVFYSSPSPESEPFVKTGSKVRKGDVLCIIEAMKLMNEITAEKDGEITQVLAQNGQIVEFEQVIFKLL